MMKNGLHGLPYEFMNTRHFYNHVCCTYFSAKVLITTVDYHIVLPYLLLRGGGGFRHVDHAL